jgi:hypothetical protein
MFLRPSQILRLENLHLSRVRESEFAVLLDLHNSTGLFIVDDEVDDEEDGSSAPATRDVESSAQWSAQFKKPQLSLRERPYSRLLNALLTTSRHRYAVVRRVRRLSCTAGGCCS